jgi:hypothetical protein
MEKSACSPRISVKLPFQPRVSAVGANGIERIEERGVGVRNHATG